MGKSIEGEGMKTRVQKYLDALEFLDSRSPVQAEELGNEIERLLRNGREVHVLSFLLGVRFAEQVQGFGQSIFDDGEEE